MPNKWVATFAERLNEALSIRDITPAELSRMTNVSEAAISNYRKGKYVPKQKRLGEFAEALNVSVSWLLGADVPIKAEHTHQQTTKSLIDEYDNIFPIETKRIPLLGEIACGEPIFAAEDRESYVLAGADINADFCLKAHGDSMVGARILDGDIVFIREQPSVENGEIAAVIIDDEATLKRVYYHQGGDKLVLQAENPAFAPLVYVGEELNSIRILGKAVAFQSDVK